MKINYRNEIQKHVFSIPALVADAIRPAFTSCIHEMNDYNASRLERIVITGCGYSYAAALSVKDQMIEFTQKPVIISPAIEISRFTHSFSNNLSNTLLIATSNSGAVSRIIEAMALYKKLGAFVIGLSGNPSSEMRNHADVLLDISSPSIGSALPLRGYVMTLLTLMAIGYTLNQRSPGLVHVDPEVVLSDYLQAASRLEYMLPGIDNAVLQYVSMHHDLRSFEFVGSGFERAAAFLGKIEMMGQAGLLASDEDSEQWCHCNFFIANPESIGTIVFLASGSPAASRTREAISYMRHLKRPVCVVTDDPSLTSTGGMQVIRLPKITVLNAGLLEMTVPSLLAGYVCEVTGETYSRGFRDQWSIFRDGRSTCISEITVEAFSYL